MEWLAMLLVVGFLGYLVLSGFKQGLREGTAPTRSSRIEPPAKKSTPRPVGDTTWPSLGLFTFPVVGESNYQRALKSLAGDHGSEAPTATFTATLIPEDNNPYDDKAIRIDITGNTVGYMSKEDARSFRRRLGQRGLKDATTTCDARISGGFLMKDGSRAHYGVDLDMKPFDN